MNKELQTALDVLLDVQDSSGMNRKKDFLISHKDNQTIQDILYFVYNPFIRTGIGWTKINNNLLIPITKPDDIDEWTIQGVFTYLIHNNTGRDKDVVHVIQFVENQAERFKKLLYDIFTKDLKLGVSTTTFNKIWPGLIPGFTVQLACKWQDNLEYLEGKEVFLTEKLDGNRCIAKVDGSGKCLFLSRSGKEIDGLDDISEELSRLVPGWYDGELIAESFNETQSQTLRKGKKSNLVFNIFDYLAIEEFESQKCIHTYSERREYLDGIFEGIEKFQYVKLVPLIDQGIFNERWVIKYLDEYTSNGSEGIMINTNVPYCFGRTCDLLKVKKMYTLDLKVVDIKEGSGLNHGKVGALIVDYKGYRVGVGSGLDNFQRELWWKYPEQILNKIIEVKCFEESTDKNRNLSLRFPVFCRVRTDKDDVSYD